MSEKQTKRARRALRARKDIKPMPKALAKLVVRSMVRLRRRGMA